MGATYQRGSKCVWVTVTWVLPVPTDIVAQVPGDPRSSPVFKDIAGDASGHIRDLLGDEKPTSLIPLDPSPISLHVSLSQSSPHQDLALLTPHLPSTQRPTHTDVPGLRTRTPCQKPACRPEAKLWVHPWYFSIPCVLCSLRPSYKQCLTNIPSAFNGLSTEVI